MTNKWSKETECDGHVFLAIKAISVAKSNGESWTLKKKDGIKVSKSQHNSKKP